MPVLVIARMTLREALRRRLLVTLAGVTFVGIVLSRLGFGRIGGFTNHGVPLTQGQVLALASQLLIVVSFVGSFIIAMGGVFAASPSIAGEVESGVLLAILPRPIRRSDVVLGKWLGLAMLVVGYSLAAGLLLLWAVRSGSGYWPPDVPGMLTALSAQGLVIMSLSLFLSTRVGPMAGGVVAVAAFGLAWIGGILGGVGTAVDNSAVRAIGTVTQLVIPTDGLWRGAVFSMEPAAVVAAGTARPEVSADPFFAASAPTGAFLAWAALWVIGVVAAAIWSFRRREL
jgi:ABC-type transport system involved in multi-copper enzyme maturation permease subunit